MKTKILFNCIFNKPSALLLPLFLLLAAFPAAAQAQFYYTTNNGAITITGFPGIDSVVTIPSTINGLPVTSIGDNAFTVHPWHTTITIPDGVTNIGIGAFSACYGLTSITIPNSVTTIGDNAFALCRSLTNVTIGSSIRNIGNSLFTRCTSLTNVTIPDNVTSIGVGAFAWCSGLTNANICNGVTNIGAGAFYNCTNLITATIGNGVTSIGGAAFSGCYSLTNVTIPNGVTSIAGGLYDNGNGGPLYSGTFAACGLINITIPDSVTNIGDQAFSDCTHLTSVILPNGVTSIGQWAFLHCQSLTNVTIPDSVTSIGPCAFNACYSLTSITIPSSITNIIDGLFWQSGLTSITIPNSVTSIGGMAFASCVNLTNITIPDSVTSIGGSAFSDSGLVNVIIPDSVTDFGSAFYHCTHLTGITIGTNVTRIVDQAFYGCGSLTSITLPESVTNIGFAAFENCASLGNITLLNGITSVGDIAFNHCTSLTNVTIPASVAYIGQQAFSACTSLTMISVDVLNPFYSSSEEGVLFNADKTRLIQYPGGKAGNYIVPSGVTSIGDDAFESCTMLTGVTIPSTVTSIGNDAFLWCASLTSVTIPNSITSIGGEAFWGSGLTSVTISDSVTNIGYHTFTACTNLTAITVDTNNSAYSSVGGVLFDKTQTTLIQYPASKSGSSYTISNSVTSIGNWAFAYSTNLTSVTIGTGVSYIGGGVFDYCPNLASIFFQRNAPTCYDDFTGSSPTIFFQNGTLGWPKPGDTWASRPATGVGSFASLPTVKITAPITTAGIFGNPALVVSGTAGGKVSLSRVLIGLDGGPVTNVATFTGISGANTNWTFTWSPPPAAGSHTVSAKAVNVALYESAVTNDTFFYQTYVPLALSVGGLGGTIAATSSTYGTPTNSATLIVGRSYTVKATPATYYHFDYWGVSNAVDGASSPTNATLIFTMQTNETLTANFATNLPTISTQPKGMTNLQGQPALFSVKATGLGLNYQWYSPAGAITSATSSGYTNIAANFGDAGGYYVVVSNVGGSVTSSVVTLTVNADTAAPAKPTFTYPKASAQLTNNIQVIDDAIIVTGTASDSSSGNVSNVFVKLNNGSFQPANVTNSPTASSVKWGLVINPAVGTNTVYAYAVDFAGNVSTNTNSLSFFFAVPTPVTVNITGNGGLTKPGYFDSVSATQLIGTNQFFVNRTYTLTATNAHNYLFTNWVNNTDNNTPWFTNVYTFTVETNLTLTVNFVTNRFVGAAGTYNGLFTDTNNGVGEASAGWFTATVTPSDSKGQSFSATLVVDGDTIKSISGSFDLSGKGTTTKPVTRPGKGTLALSLQLDFDNNTLGGTVSNTADVWNSTLSGDLSVYSATSNTPYAGTYNLLIPGCTTNAGPTGYGYATVTVAAKGTVTPANATLADGQTFTPQTAPVAANGDWPVYAPVYAYAFNTGSNTVKSYQGAVLGWLNFSNGVPTGSLFWIKTAGWTNGYYTGGFTNESSIYSSAVTNPVSGLLFSNTLVTLEGGNLLADVTNHVTISNAVVKFIGTTNALMKLTFKPTTDVASGSYKNAVTGQTNSFSGLYLPDQKTIGGFFLDNTNAGSLLIQ